MLNCHIGSNLQAGLLPCCSHLPSRLSPRDLESNDHVLMNFPGRSYRLSLGFLNADMVIYRDSSGVNSLLL